MQEQQHQVSQNQQYIQQRDSFTLESPIRSSRTQTALSNVTNNLQNQSPANNKSFSPSTGIHQMVKSPSFSTSNHQNPQRKSVALEQENQLLKTQIEFLKAALLGVCKDKNLQIPLPLMPESSQDLNLHDLQLLTLNLISSPLQQQSQNHNPHSQHQSPSPFKHTLPYQSKPTQQHQQQPFIQFTDISAINQKDENSLSKFSMCYSPAKSPTKSQRRKRSERKELQQRVDENGMHFQNETSPTNLREDLPLQMNFRKPPNQNTDDTLVFDKSMDIVLQSRENPKFTQLAATQANPEQLEVQNSPENDKANTSQIQLKYAKMLEELDNESLILINPAVILEETEEESTPREQEQNENQSEIKQEQLNEEVEMRQQLCTLKELKTVDVQDQLPPLEEDEYPFCKPQHQKNQLSSHYETKHYYEQELNTLKTELELFEQEEEKLLTLMISTKRPSLEANYAIIQESPEHNHQADVTQEAIYDSHKKENREWESFQYVSGQAIEEFHQVQQIQEQEVSQEQMMRNLQDAYEQLQQIQEDPEEDSFIKPIKILSPLNKVAPILIPSTLESNLSLASYRRHSKSKERYCNRTPIQKDLTKPVASPINFEAPQFSIFSTDKQQLAATQSSPYCDRYMHHHHQKSSQRSSVDMSQTKKQIVQQKIVTTASIQNSRHKSVQQVRPQSTRGIKQITDQKNMHRSPSKFSVRNLLSAMAQEKHISPIRHHQKFHGKSVQQNTSQTEDSLDNEKHRMETLENLARRESMAKNLKQQVEPSEDEILHVRISDSRSVITPFQQTQNFDFMINPLPVDRLMSEEDEVRCCHEASEEKPLINENSDKYFGLYSFEKSEQLKQQRVQSIKKAEELLSQFMSESKQVKRPEFIQQIKSISVIERLEQKPLINEEVEHINGNQYCEPHVQLINEVSFQHEQDIKCQPVRPVRVRDSTRSSLLSNNLQTFDLVNLELSPEPKQITIDMQTCNFQTFDDIPMSVNSMTPQELTVQQTPQQPRQLNSHYRKPSDDYNYDSNRQVYQQQPSKMLVPRPQTSTGNRRKSLESTQITSNSSKLTTLLLTSKKKSSQLRKPTTISTAQNDRNSAFNQTQTRSISKTNVNENIKKCAPQTCKISEPQIEIVNSVLQTPSNNHLQTRKVEEPGFIRGTIVGSMAMLDAEALYEHRSKSVTKKREEIQRKKQQETMSKIEAKNNKIDSFKQTRNLNRLQSTQRLGCSSNETTKSNIVPQNMVSHQQQQQLYHSKQKSRISFDSTSLSHTPVRNKSVENKNPYHGNNTQQMQSTIDSIKKSASKSNQIKFEKRRLLDNQQTVVNEYSQTQSAKNMNTISQNPMSMMVNYMVPSSNQSKSSKMVSECQSYRKGKVDDQTPTSLTGSTLDERQNKLQKSASKTTTCNMLYKKSQQNLKSNIPNRALKMQNQTKDYNQLKQEHQRLKQVLQSTIDLGHEKNSSGVHPVQSFILQKISQQQVIKRKAQVPKTEDKKVLNSSRSATKMNPATSQQVVASVCQKYQTIQVDEDPSESMNKQNKECANCQRLRIKGISTDFCLEHYGTPRYIDE